MACRRPSSSGTPRICWARSLVNVWRREEISPRGSLEGGLGKPLSRSRARIMDFSSSSWISGSLWDDKKKNKKPVTRKMERRDWETSSKSSPIEWSLIYPQDWKSLNTFGILRRVQTMVALSQKNPVPFAWLVTMWRLVWCRSNWAVWRSTSCFPKFLFRFEWREPNLSPLQLGYDLAL